jgi:hypothetical protein
LPLIEGKMQGDRLKGDRVNANRLQDKFHADIAGRYRLSRGNRKRLNIADKQILEKLVLTRLKSDPVMQSSVYACVRDDIHKSPIKYAQLLGIETTIAISKKSKSFVDICRSTGKGSFVR